jgi:hypothetical protein
MNFDFECPWGTVHAAPSLSVFLAVTIDFYNSLPKTSNLTPPELMRNAGRLAYFVIYGGDSNGLYLKTEKS